MPEVNSGRSIPGAGGDAIPAPPTAAGIGASTAEGLELVRAFMSIQDAALRRSVINMIQVLALEPKR